MPAGSSPTSFSVFGSEGRSAAMKHTRSVPTSRKNPLQEVQRAFIRPVQVIQEPGPRVSAWRERGQGRERFLRSASTRASPGRPFTLSACTPCGFSPRITATKGKDLLPTLSSGSLYGGFELLHASASLSPSLMPAQAFSISMKGWKPRFFPMDWALPSRRSHVGHALLPAKLCQKPRFAHARLSPQKDDRSLSGDEFERPAVRAAPAPLLCPTSGE